MMWYTNSIMLWLEPQEQENTVYDCNIGGFDRSRTLFGGAYNLGCLHSCASPRPKCMAFALSALNT